jgi:hypothetical protein
MESIRDIYENFEKGELKKIHTVPTAFNIQDWASIYKSACIQVYFVNFKFFSSSF